MDDDGTFAGTVVHPRLESVQTQRVTVLAAVALRGAEQAQARLIAALGVGKARGEILAGMAPVGDQIAQQQALLL
ncbi:hypothetical protein D3C80_1298280 [compost metagenome]